MKNFILSYCQISKIIALLAFSLTVSIASETGFFEDELVYVVNPGSTSIHRYDFETNSWNSPLSFTDPITAFAVDDDFLYVAFDRKIDRYDLAGENRSLFANSADTVSQLLSGDGLLFVIGGDSNANVSGYDKSTFAQTDTFGSRFQGGAISESLNRIYGRSRGYSPSDIVYREYSETGESIRSGESPYHGDYSSGTRVWLNPTDTLAFDNSGTVYNATDLTYAFSLGENILDLDFRGEDIPIVLTDEHLIAFSNTILETGRFLLTSDVKKIVVRDDGVHCFIPDATIDSGFRVEVVSFESFAVSNPGQSIDPTGIPYEATNAIIGNDGILYILSKPLGSVFRWDLEEQVYLESLPLRENASVMAYSENLNRIYVYSETRRIFKIDLEGGPSPAELFVTVPLSIDTMIPLDDDLMVLRNGSWDDQWIYSAEGSLLAAGVDCCYHDYHFYDAPRGLIYFDGFQSPYLGNGEFGTAVGGRSSFEYLALSADGTTTIDGQGILRNSSSRDQVGILPNDVVKAVWTEDGTLFTLERPLSTGYSWDPVYEERTTVQKWSATQDLLEEIVLNGVFIDILTDGTEITVLVDEGGVPLPYRFNSDLSLIPPTALGAPVIIAEAETEFSASITWSNVFGANEYTIERKIDNGSWMPLTTEGAIAAIYTDTTLSPGNSYTYRVFAQNGDLHSTSSNEELVDLSNAIDSRVNPESVIFSPDEAFIDINDRLLFWVKDLQSIFVFNIDTLEWENTIPLLGEPKHVSYSESLDVLFTAYEDGQLRKITLSDTNPVEAYFAQLDSFNSTSNLTASGSNVFVSQDDNYFLLDNSGNIIAQDEGYYRLQNGISNSAGTVLYHIRPTSPRDILATQTSPDANFGTQEDSPYHNSTGMTGPLSLSPGGSTIVTAAGHIFEANTLERRAEIGTGHTVTAWITEDLILRAVGSSLQKVDALTGTIIQTRPLLIEPKYILPVSDRSKFAVIFENTPNGMILDLFGADLDPTPPAELKPPSKLFADLNSSGQVILSWSDVLGDNGYRVERRAQGASIWETIKTTDLNETSVTDINTTIDAVYEYRVWSINGEASSILPTSLTISISAPDEIPQNLTATATTPFTVSLEWDLIPGVNLYLVSVYEVNSGSLIASNETNSSTQTTIVENLLPDRDYRFTISPKNGLGTGPESAPLDVTTDAVAPSIPVLTQYSVSDISAYLRISNVPYARRVVVERREAVETSEDAWQTVHDVALHGSFYQDIYFTDAPLLPQTDYIYRAFAETRTNRSDNSDLLNITTTNLRIPNSPSTPLIRNIEDYQIVIEGFYSAGADSYLIERSIIGTSDWVPLNTVTQSDYNKFIDSTAVIGYAYVYRIRASNVAGSSHWRYSYESFTPLNIITFFADDFDDGLDQNWGFASGVTVESDEDGGSLAFSGGLNQSVVSPTFVVTQATRVEFKIVSVHQPVTPLPYSPLPYSYQPWVGAGGDITLNDDFSNISFYEHSLPPLLSSRQMANEEMPGIDDIGSYTSSLTVSPLTLLEVRDLELYNPGSYTSYFTSSPTVSPWASVETPAFNSAELLTSLPLSLEYRKVGDVSWQSLGTISDYWRYGQNQPSDGTISIDFTYLSSISMGDAVEFRIHQALEDTGYLNELKIDDFKILGAKPNLPELSPFILAASNSSQSAALYWVNGSHAASYRIERNSGGGFEAIAKTSPNINYYLDTGLASDSPYSYRIIAENAAGDSVITPSAVVWTLSQIDEWMVNNYGSVEGSESILLSRSNDGSTMLERFAFGLDAHGHSYLADTDDGEIGGHPRLFLDRSTGKLCAHFYRRNPQSNPGIRYRLLVSDDLENWEEAGHFTTIETVDSQMEWVEWTDQSNTDASRFVKIEVSVE